MKIAIVGFPGCGKSTCFKAITSLDPAKAHLGAVKIPDPRLEKLKNFFNPKKITHAEIIFRDLPGFRISDIKEIEALLEVLGMFSGRDPVKDKEDMDLEFMLADLEIINKRLPSLEKELQQEKTREKSLEKEALLKCRRLLEGQNPLRAAELAPLEKKAIRGFQFLSEKPLFILGNIEEKDTKTDAVRKLEIYSKEKNFKSIEFCAKLEAEITDLEDFEKDAFLKEMGLKETARDRVISLAYGALGYVTFFTTRGSETKAWPVKKGTTAVEAAGKIHSDMQKGFIKAEVINLSDLESCGSLQEARKKALLKLEGKDYKIQDGDIIDFRFNV